MRGDSEETGRFAINIHRGGNTATSSEGCQTIPPAQWPAFIALVETELKRNNAKTLSYVLVSN
jgi:lysozyme